MCSEVHGFADEFNHKFIITAPQDFENNSNESVVLVVRAFPMYLGSLSTSWLSVRAQYRTEQGSQAELVSDNNGIIQINSIASETDIEVTVNKVRKDGPAPFRFYSFHANFPSCYMEVGPTNSFIAPVPVKLRASSALTRVYFKTLLPSSNNAIKITALNSPSVKFIDVLSDDRKQFTRYGIDEVIPGMPGKNVFFSLVTGDAASSAEYELLYLAVEYTTSDGKAPSGGGGKGGDSTSGGTSNETKEEGSSTFYNFLILVLVLLLLYMVGGSFYNYTRNDIREFPDYIPHSNTLRHFAQGSTNFFSTLKGNRRQEYAPVNGYGDRAGGGRNPYDL
ncbi:Autophagy-related protein 27, putative [Angomonas deanei]|uniref:Autophagy-related protein 27, putative n=1 Tax=Angomonas deanei TaxID=59799 RepID=A0A7G2CID2_9TRYP|nr:Autophagy-related protein 27, putative [Angomonas deanei]